MSTLYDQLSAENFLKQLKGLTLDQYDACKVVAITRVGKLIGEQPTRQGLKREQGSLLTPLDILAVIVFVAAFLISSIHIVVHMGKIASTTYEQYEIAEGEFDLSGQPMRIVLGIVVDGQTYALAHQFTFVFLAEASMLLFMVTWRMQTKHTESSALKLGRGVVLKLPIKLFSVYLGLSVIAMLFVLKSNLESGLPILEALMPPMFTIGLGLHVEKLIVEMLERRDALSLRYLEKMDIWEKSTEDQTTHPHYRELLMREIWDKLVRLKDNKIFADVPARLKLAAVHRELERDGWTSEAIQVEARVIEVQKQLGITDIKVAENLVINDGDLLSLSDLVKNANAGANSKINTPAGTADLEKLEWTNHKDGKTYGPYSSRNAMIISIRSHAKRTAK